jgi:hypothetical protein
MLRSRERSVDLGYVVGYREIRVRFPAEAKILVFSAALGLALRPTPEFIPREFHGIDVGNVADVSNVHLASIFRIEACMMEAFQCLYRFMLRKATRRGNAPKHLLPMHF